MSLLHATCVTFDGHGLLLTGPSGSGKSDLALRLLRCGAGLVSDDQVEVGAADSCLIATAPAAISGLIEVRGVGLVQLPTVARSVLRLVLELTPNEEVPRLPDAGSWRHDGITLPCYRLNPFESSAVDKVLLLLRAQDEDILQT
jgi:HPr kinase/phosphorylase